MVVELILPNSTMKKYINMVVGLLLILIFLQPLFQLFQVDVEDVFTSGIPTLDTSGEEEMMKNSIELKKREIQASQDAYVLEEMAVQMINKVEEGLVEEYGVEIVDINYQFKDDQLDMEKLKNTNVMLRKNDEKKSSDGVVNEVVIDTNRYKKPEQPTPESEEINSYLSDQWQLDQELITILWEGGI